MSDGFELRVQLNDAIAEGFAAQDEWRDDQIRRVKAEAAYREAKSVAFARARAEGMPVTVMADITKDTPEVLTHWTAWQMAEANEKAQHEKLLLMKKKIDVLRDEISREWGKARVIG